MATYYVRPDGSDTNAGTGSGTASAWKTLNKVYTTSTITNGDIIYVAPGHYRETARVSVAWTTTTAEIRVVGDPAATLVAWGSGVTAGPVIHSTFGTNDNTRNTTYGLLLLQGRDYITWENINFYCTGNNVLIDGTGTQNATNLKWKNCRLHADQSIAVWGDFSSGTVANWTFERCLIITRGNIGIAMQFPSISGSNWDVGLTVHSCVFFTAGDYGIKVYWTGGFANGAYSNVNIYNCWFGGYHGINADTNIATAGWTVRNCTFWHCAGNALRAVNTTLVSEDYNRFVNCGTNRSGVNTGSNSKDGIDALDLGQAWNWGLNLLPYMPYSGSAADNAGTTNSGAAPTKDYYNRDFDGTPSVAPAEYGVISTGSGGGLLVHPGTNGRING